jgi:hypothetical protein
MSQLVAHLLPQPIQQSPKHPQPGRPSCAASAHAEQLRSTTLAAETFRRLSGSRIS